MYNYDGGTMKKISEKESEIANILNEKRPKSYIDIYKETEFLGLGILVDQSLDVYEYKWGMFFNKETHNFANNTFLFKSDKKINYLELEKYLIDELKIIEQEYNNNETEEESYSEIIRLKTYVNEFSNKELYDKIKMKIFNMIEEDL